MKVKTLLKVLFVVCIFYFYNQFIYHFVLKVVNKETKTVIKEMIGDNTFKGALYNKEHNYIEVYSKDDRNDYYTFYFRLDNGYYKLMDVKKEVPIYIK